MYRLSWHRCVPRNEGVLHNMLHFSSPTRRKFFEGFLFATAVVSTKHSLLFAPWRKGDDHNPFGTTGSTPSHNTRSFVSRHVYTNSSSTVAGMDPSVVMEVVMIAEYMVLPSLTGACQSELGRYVNEESAALLARFSNRYCLLKLESLCQELLLSSTTGGAGRASGGSRRETPAP